MVCCLVRDAASVRVVGGALEQIARASSPRVMRCGESAVVFDVAGLSRVCGPPDVIAREVIAQAEACGLAVRLAIAGTMTAAWVLAHARAGSTLVPPGGDAAALAPLPIGWLLSVIDLDRATSTHVATGDVTPVRRGRRTGGRHYRMAPAPDVGGLTVQAPGADRRPGASPERRPGASPERRPGVSSERRPGVSPERSPGVSPERSRGADAEWTRRLTTYRERLATFERWGIRTCADLAALPRADIHARMGPAGIRLHQAAVGEDVAPLVPVDDARVFRDRVELEWPIEGLEPLSFVLARQCERLSAELERADRGAVALHTTLTLVTRASHVRVLALPAPMRDAKVLRTLILLDLESHPPPAAIDAVDLRLDVTPGRIVQTSLLARAVPSPEQVSTLLARLTALCGDGRVGAPVLLDTHDGRQCAIKPFRAPPDTMRAAGAVVSTAMPAVAGADDRPAPVAPHLRRLRLPIAARVITAHGAPARVVLSTHAGGGDVRACAGPWRTSGAWWDLQKTATWDRDEWDVELTDGAVYRLVRHRGTGQWESDGVFD